MISVSCAMSVVTYMTKGSVHGGGFLAWANGFMQSISHLVLGFGCEHQEDVHKVMYQQGQHDLIEGEF